MEQVNIENYKNALDVARRVAPNGSEYWMARDIQAVLGYVRWENFIDIIQKARLSCESASVPSEYQFRQTTKVILQGKGVQRKIEDWFLSRFACYLIAMNGDPRVPQVAFAQQYFAVQTRLREIDTDNLGYDRVAHRLRVTQQIKALNSAAKQVGVQNYGLFHDAGYRGLYGGLGRKEIKRKKNIPESEELLDCAGRAELAANEFKASQTEQKLLRDRIEGQQQAIDTHYRVGSEVRAAIKRIGGTMPEDLPAEESIKRLTTERRVKPTPRLL